MGWRNLPYWLKGGIISFLIVFIWGILDFVLFHTMITIMLICVSFTGIFLCKPLNIGYGNYDTLLIILALISYFLLGAIIGLIVGKIRSRKA